MAGRKKALGTYGPAPGFVDDDDDVQDVPVAANVAPIQAAPKVAEAPVYSIETPGALQLAKAVKVGGLFGESVIASVQTTIEFSPIPFPHYLVTTQRGKSAIPVDNIASVIIGAVRGRS